MVSHFLKNPLSSDIFLSFSRSQKFILMNSYSMIQPSDEISGVLDPDSNSMGPWIRLRIRNPNPNQGGQNDSQK
jgi:hypothetical protein